MPIAVVEPVEVGISDWLHARARRRSLCGVSRIDWVLVMSWMVVIIPWRMPIFPWMTLTTGAGQLVVQEAAVSSWCSAGSLRWTISSSGKSQPARKASRPMRPKPLIPMRVAMLL